MNSDHLTQWTKALRVLIEHEARFGELCVSHAAGSEVEEARAILEGLRLLSDEAFTKAFPALAWPRR
jgi:hypothetical protein